MYDFSLFLGTDSPLFYKNIAAGRQISIKVNCYNDRATPGNLNKNVSNVRHETGADLGLVNLVISQG